MVFSIWLCFIENYFRVICEIFLSFSCIPIHLSILLQLIIMELEHFRVDTTTLFAAWGLNLTSQFSHAQQIPFLTVSRNTLTC